MNRLEVRLARATAALRAIDSKINKDAQARSGSAEGGHTMSETERMSALGARRMARAEFVEARATVLAYRRFPPLPAGRAALGLRPIGAADPPAPVARRSFVGLALS
jgi:hypothetical protein